MALHLGGDSLIFLGRLRGSRLDVGRRVVQRVSRDRNGMIEIGLSSAHGLKPGTTASGCVHHFVAPGGLRLLPVSVRIADFHVCHRQCVQLTRTGHRAKEAKFGLAASQFSFW